MKEVHELFWGEFKEVLRHSKFQDFELGLHLFELYGSLGLSDWILYGQKENDIMYSYFIVHYFSFARVIWAAVVAGEWKGKGYEYHNGNNLFSAWWKKRQH